MGAWSVVLCAMATHRHVGVDACTWSADACSPLPACPCCHRCPAFKLLTYYGGVKERAAKRQGWSKPNAFHVCITSYTLVLQVGGPGMRVCVWRGS